MPKSLLALLITFSVLITACGTTAAPTATPRPTQTPTPFSTPLPTVETQVPIGSSQHPYHFALYTEDRSASGSALGSLLSAKTGSAFVVDLVSARSDVLTQLCSDKPTAAVLDGRALLSADAQGCGTIAFRLVDSSNAKGTSWTIIYRASTDKGSVQKISDLKGRDFCRLSENDADSWSVTALYLKANGINPVTDLKGIKSFSDYDALVQGIADGVCAAGAIPSGTLSSHTPKITNAEVKVLTTTPELAFGGIAISNTIPKAVADALMEQLGKNPDELTALLRTYKLAPATISDFADFTNVTRAAGLNLKTIGQ